MTASLLARSCLGGRRLVHHHQPLYQHGTPIQKTTSYIGELWENLGLDVEYHVWEGPTYPNVIGELPGLVDPENVFIIGGHVDDVSGTPGADDNASGSRRP